MIDVNSAPAQPQAQSVAELIPRALLLAAELTAIVFTIVSLVKAARAKSAN